MANPHLTPGTARDAKHTVFQDERVKLLDSLPQPKDSKSKKSHGKIGFAGLARTIADKWKAANSSTKAYYEQLAAKEKRQYALDMIKWAQDQEATTAEPVPSVEQTEEVYNTVSPDHSVASSVQKYPACTEATVPSPVSSYEGCFAPALDDNFRLSTSERMNQMMRASQQPSCYPRACSAWKSSKSKMEPSSYASGYHPTSTPPASSSADMLNAFLEQPGMADLVSQMYQLLSQRMDPNMPGKPEQANNRGAPFPRRNSCFSAQLRRKSMDMFLNDPLLGNLEPLDQDNQDGIDADAANWLGDIFTSL
jgi:hypothetical protein